MPIILQKCAFQSVRVQTMDIIQLGIVWLNASIHYTQKIQQQCVLFSRIAVFSITPLLIAK